MKIWKWKAVDEKGSIQQGIWEENLESTLISHLRRQKLYPVRISHSVLRTLLNRIHLRNGKLYWARVARKINLLLEAGIPLLTVFEIIRDKESNIFRKNQWERVSSRIQSGNDFSASLEEFSPQPGPFFESMVKAGEKSGTLATSFLDIAEQLEEEYFFEQKIKGALFYPSLLLVISLFVIYTLSVVILPMYEVLFQSLNAELPFITQVLFQVGSKVPYLLFVAIIFFVISYLYKNGKSWSIPGTKKIRKIQTIMQFCTILERLLDSGLPLLEAFNILEKISKEPALLGLITELKLSVQEGKRISPVILTNGYFPSEAAKMLSIAEESGKLSGMLRHMAYMFKKELEEKIQQYSRLLEPMLVLGMAGLVGIVAVGVLLPIFDVSMHIR